MRRILMLVLAVAGLVVLAGCGEKSDDTGTPDADQLRLMLDFFPNADHAGIYGAIANGNFRRAGLDVQPQTPPDPAGVLTLLNAGKVDLAISYEPEVLLARDKGLDVVAIGAIVQAPLTSVISLPPAKISKPADLAGKSVGTAGIPYQTAFLETILKEAGKPPDSAKETNVGYNLVPTLLGKKVDAVLGAFWNYEGVQLQLEKKRPQIIRMERAGVPIYNELVFVARRSDLKENREEIRAFLQAVGAGYQQLRTDPKPAIDALIKANPDLNRKLQEESVKATLPVFFPGGDRPFGFMDPGQWRVFGNWMLENDLVTKQPAADTARTNEFLPGEGLP